MFYVHGGKQMGNFYKLITWTAAHLSILYTHVLYPVYPSYGWAWLWYVLSTNDQGPWYIRLAHDWFLMTASSCFCKSIDYCSNLIWISVWIDHHYSFSLLNSAPDWFDSWTCSQMDHYDNHYARLISLFTCKHTATVSLSLLPKYFPTSDYRRGKKRDSCRSCLAKLLQGSACWCLWVTYFKQPVITAKDKTKYCIY